MGCWNPAPPTHSPAPIHHYPPLRPVKDSQRAAMSFPGAFETQREPDHYDATASRGLVGNRLLLRGRVRLLRHPLG